MMKTERTVALFPAVRGSDMSGSSTGKRAVKYARPRRRAPNPSAQYVGQCRLHRQLVVPERVAGIARVQAVGGMEPIRVLRERIGGTLLEQADVGRPMRGG